MITFAIHYLEPGTADTWEKVLPLYPFTYAELLDERLDEATVTVFSRVPCFKCMTVFRVTISETGEADTVTYYSLGNDNSPEYIPGSGLYKHSLCLIEYTKTLEGILCQTLTFTNDLGRLYLDEARAIYPTDIDDGEWPAYTTIDDILSSGEYNPDTMHPPTFASVLNGGTPLYIPSLNEMASFFKAYENVVEPSYSPWRVVSETYDRGTQVTASIHINNNGVNTVISSLVKGATITPRGYVTVKYKIVLRPIEDLTGYANDRVMYFGWSLVAATNQYPLRKWTITDVTNRCLELAEPLYGTETPRFMMDAEDAARYANVLAPEFSMTACTLREQLKIIGGYIHAEPRLVWPNVIKFVPIAQQRRAMVDVWNVPYTYRENSIGINEYCTSLRSTASNLVQSLPYGAGTMYEPARGVGEGAYRSMRSEIAYVRITEENAIIATQYPIYQIEDLRVGIDGNLTPVPVKKYVFEQTEYAANLSDTHGEFPKSKAYAIYYTQGQKNIKGMFFRAEEPPSIFIPDAFKKKFSISRILARCTSEKTLQEIENLLVENPQWLIAQVVYRPIYPALLSHGKPLYDSDAPKFEKIYQQGENLLESLYFGENLKGAAARLGNVQEQRTYILPRLSAVPSLSETIGGMSISGIKTEILSSYVRTTVELTKDYNRISEYVGIDSQKRVYEVSEKNAYDRSVLLRAFIVVGGKELTSDASPFSLDLDTVALLFGEHVATADAVSNCLVQGYDANDGPLNKIYLPVVASAIGNAMLFSFAYKDNYSAGAASVYTELENNTHGYFSQDIPYGDFFGRIHSVHFSLSSSPAVFSESVNPKFAMPNGSYASHRSKGDLIMDANARYLVRKDNRERLSFNLEIEYRSAASEIVVGSALAYLCGLVNGEYRQNVGAPRLYVLKNASVFNDLGISKLTREILTLPEQSDDNFFVYKGITDEDDPTATPGDFYIERNTDENNRCTSFSVKMFGNLPVFDNYGETVYGWIIATPVTETEQTVSDDSGGTYTETVYKGGDVLLMSTKNYTSAQGSNPPDIFENCKFVFKNK